MDEISKELKIAKSTASAWLRKVEPTKQARETLEKKRLLARANGLNSIQRNRALRRNQLQSDARAMVSKFEYTDPLFCKILCSLLYWGEGSKTEYRFAFTNSDPTMVKTFIKLLRNSFSLKEDKFMALVHVHEYHDEIEIKNYWSKLTGIPLSQFTKSYLKPHTKTVVRPGYKGTLRIAYHDSKIVNELMAIYNELAQTI